MTVMMTSPPVHTDPLDPYFGPAAHELGDRGAGADHACERCGVPWPCPKALAAAFILDLHDVDPVP